MQFFIVFNNNNLKVFSKLMHVPKAKKNDNKKTNIEIFLIFLKSFCYFEKKNSIMIF